MACWVSVPFVRDKDTGAVVKSLDLPLRDAMLRQGVEDVKDLVYTDATRR